MHKSSDRPLLFVQHRCPFALKVRLYLLESGVFNSVDLREATSPDEEQSMRDEVSQHLEEIEFPAARFGQEYVSGSDVIIERLVQKGGPAPAQLPTLQAYLDGPFAQLHEFVGRITAMEEVGRKAVTS